LKLQGATCSDNKLSLSHTISTELPLTALHWAKLTDVEKLTTTVTLPVYLNFTRADLHLHGGPRDLGARGRARFYERGVALLCAE
ncbi:cytoplasmic dynein 1 heavy chain 1-like, partial [Lethenteron reissneri]|uniref:cytoplasmic dynein 1 heavy chain 1-like n=1 Tax=Lethenteron reissneri TaxID=7753 RepID=UPI002AB5F84D